MYTKLFGKSKPTIQFVAQVIGNIVANFPAVPLGPLFYRALEPDKIVGLMRHKQDHDTKIELFNKACGELVWWKHNIKVWRSISRIEIMHINVLELKTAFIGIRKYCHKRSYKHIRVMSDSSTAVAYINNKGGIKSKNGN